MFDVRRQIPDYLGPGMGEYLLERGTRGLTGVIYMFYILTVVEDTQLYTCEKNLLNLRWVHCSLCDYNAVKVHFLRRFVLSIRMIVENAKWTR